MSRDALRGGAPRGLARPPAIIPRGDATRRNTNLGADGFDPKCVSGSVFVVYVEPNRKAHDKFAHVVRSLCLPAPEPVRAEGGAVVTIRANRDNGGTAQREYPQAYEVSIPRLPGRMEVCPATLAAVVELDIVESWHPAIGVSRFHAGGGAGEMTERITRILRDERREAGYRAGECSREAARTGVSPAGRDPR